MRRRDYLKAIGGLSGITYLAGCPGSRDEGEPESDPETPAVEQTPGDVQTQGEPTPSQERTPGIQRGGIEFDRVVNAVDDLGLDPTGNEPFGKVLTEVPDGTLVQFPEGTYQFGANRLWIGEQTIGMEGTGRVTLVPPEGNNEHILTADGGNALYFGGFNVDQTIPETVGAFRLIARQRVYIEDVQFFGRGDRSTDHVNNMLHVSLEDPDGQGVVRNVVSKRNHWAKYANGSGRIGIWSGSRHRGTVRIVDCDLREFGNNALYTSRCPGKVQVEDSYFENNNASSVRIGGEGSYAENCLFVVDLEKYTGPRDREGDDFYHRGVVVEEHFQQLPDQKPAGARVRNCEFLYENVPNSTPAVTVWSNGRTLELQNCRFVFNNDGANAVIERHSFSNRGNRGNPPGSRPRWLRITNTSIEGNADVNYAVSITDGNNSHISSCCIGLTGGNAGGVFIADSDGCLVENTAIDVAGESVVTQKATPTVRNIYDVLTAQPCSDSPAAGSVR